MQSTVQRALTPCKTLGVITGTQRGSTLKKTESPGCNALHFTLSSLSYHPEVFPFRLSQRPSLSSVPPSHLDLWKEVSKMTGWFLISPSTVQRVVPVSINKNIPYPQEPEKQAILFVNSLPRSGVSSAHGTPKRPASIITPSGQGCRGGGRGCQLASKYERTGHKGVVFRLPSSWRN